jgi:Amt family ammonium transporter
MQPDALLHLIQPNVIQPNVIQPDALLHIWWLVAAMLVFMMQVGFLLLETGLIQERHMAGIAVKSMMMLLASSTAYTLFGFRYMWGTSPLVHSGEWQFYQTGFAAVAATILSGALAGRTTLISNVIMATFVGGILFPFHGRWVWGDGWPWPDMRVHDFAGSGCVHLLGGLVALAGAIIAGPRSEKKDMSRRDPIHISPRSLPLAACGVLFLWIGWMGFNGGSIQSPDRLNTVGHLIISTCLAASAGGLSVCCAAGLWRLLTPGNYIFAPYATLSGIMAGMVANSACCDLIYGSSLKPLIVGTVAGIVAYVSNGILQWYLRIDDPIEAIAVHAGGGITGLLFAGLFQSPVRMVPQVFDIFALVVIAFIPSCFVFYLIDRLEGWEIGVRLKSTTREEDLGLIFDDPISRVGQPPIEIHYLPRDLQKQFIDWLLLQDVVPLHNARSLQEAARDLISKMKNLFSSESGKKSDLSDLEELMDELATRIDSVPRVMERLAKQQGERVLLGPVVEKIAASYRARYPNFTIELEPFDATFIQGDRELTREAIRMLVSNSARACSKQRENVRDETRYTPTIKIRCDKKPEGGSYVCLHVLDNGEGVDPEIRHYLGQPFTGLKRAGAGSGLGLFFAAYIVQAFGGRIDCLFNSREQVGRNKQEEEWTHFIITLKLYEI